MILTKLVNGLLVSDINSTPDHPAILARYDTIRYDTIRDHTFIQQNNIYT